MREASCQEIIRRYYAARCAHRKGSGTADEVYKAELLMKQAKVTEEDRPVVAAALKKAQEAGDTAAAMMLQDGRIITGRTSDLLGASSALLLNALKALGGIQDDIHLISPIIIEPIQQLKTQHLGNNNPRLHTDEVLIALSICAATNPTAALALSQLPKLKDTEVHSTVILSSVDETTLRKLGVNLTCEPKYYTKGLYHK